MAAGEPDFDTPAHVQDAAIAAMRRGETHYTAADGTRALKEAVARKFRNENGLAFGIDQISVGSGAKQVIFNALAATLDPGDEVIVPIPYYPSYLEIARMCGAVPIVVNCPRNNGFRLLPADLAAAITPRTRWLVLNAPSNPSGAAYSAADLAALAVVLLRHPHVWVLSDDIYEHLLFAAAPFATIAAVEPRLAPRTLTVNGVSKAYCMTGWRVGYAGGPADLIRAMAIVQSQVTSSPCSISQAAACAALDGPQDVVTALRERFRARRDLVVGLLTEVRLLECFLPDGAFYAFPS
jgi:aspartate aminotransferase